VSVIDGWPECLPGNVVVAVEAGITLGSLGLHEATYEALRHGTSVASVRIDDHPVEDGWKALAPDGAVVEERTFVIPMSPVVVPAPAFSNNSAFQDWTWETHGALGRLLLWNEPPTWWLLNDPDLETTLICADAEFLSRLPGDDLLLEARSTPVASWIPTLNERGRAEAAALTRRYGLANPD
jgi:hypothetical protein